jgi:hypothetical protein
MNSFMLQPGEEKIIADHLVQLLRTHSARAFGPIRQEA